MSSLRVHWREPGNVIELSSLQSGLFRFHVSGQCSCTGKSGGGGLAI